MLNGAGITYKVHDLDNIKGFFDSYRWLSNYHEVPVMFEGVMYPSSEAAYQAAKTLDLEARKAFVLMKANESKKAGKALKNIRPGWNDIKYEIMAQIVFDKFMRHKDLRSRLLDTGDRYIEETNHWKDTYWGVCNGVGQNNLGKILMKIRDFWKE
jgi:ribA/ribD-fused uncharacterized protein